MERRGNPGAGAWLVRVLAGIALLGALPGLGAVGRVGAQADAPATVRIIHGVSDVGPIDLYIDGAIAVVGAAFPSVTDPLSLPAGEHRIVVTPSGAGPEAALVESTLPLDPGATDEIAVVGSAAALSGILFEIDRSPLPAGQARFRVVHVSPDAGPVDPALVGGDTLFPTVDYRRATEYADLPAGVYPLELRVSGTDVLTLAVPDLELAAGVVTDVYLVGQAADGTLQALVVTTTVEGTIAVVGQVASLRAGTCAEPGGEVAALAPVAEPAGAAVGTTAGGPVTTGFATAPVAFDALVAADHVVAVAAADGSGLVACGAIGGRLTDDGSLVVALRDPAAGSAAGVAVLSPNALDPAATDVSVFLLGVPPAATSDGGGAEAPAAQSAAPAAPVTVTVEAIGTPGAEGGAP